MMKERDLDLLLVNPGGRKRTYQSLSNSLVAIEPPIWAGLIANFIRRYDFSVSILDANAENLDIEETVDTVIRTNPLLVAIIVYGHNPSASTQVMSTTSEICTALKMKNYELRIILVGGHVSTLPEQTLREENIDFVAGGEGPYTILDLLRILKTDSADYKSVRGLWYKNNDTIKSNLSAPLIIDLDKDMPGVAWDLLPVDKYQAHNWHCFGGISRKPYAAIYTTLGCPFHCDFCCIQSPFRDGEKLLGYNSNVSSYRLWSPQTAIDQIDILVNEYNIYNIKFADEIFALNTKHVTEICDLIISRGYDLNIWAYARVDNLNKKILHKMKLAGINWLGIGVESASHRVRNGINKGYSQKYIFDAVEKMRTENIYIGANYIFGLPDDDMESMKNTLDLALTINSEWANFYCAMAYPGSRLYDMAIKNNWKLPESWSGYSQYAVDTLPLPTKYLSSEEVLRFRDYAFQTYFSSPNYLNMILQKFGEDTILDIENMTSYKIDRKFVRQNDH